MGKFFPKLTQTKVRIDTDENGGGFDCPMLPVSALNDIESFGQKLDAAIKENNLKAIGEVKQDMLDLAKTVIPEEYHTNLLRLDIQKCTELLAYLMYGDPEGNDQPKNEKN